MVLNATTPAVSCGNHSECWSGRRNSAPSPKPIANGAAPSNRQQSDRGDQARGRSNSGALSISAPPCFIKFRIDGMPLYALQRAVTLCLDLHRFYRARPKDRGDRDRSSGWRIPSADDPGGAPPTRARSSRNGGRNHLGTLSDIKNRNDRRHHRGFAGDFPRRPGTLHHRIAAGISLMVV